MEDAKQAVEEQSFDDKADAFFDAETETPAESSPETKPAETEETEPKDTSAETEKPEPSEEKESEVPKEFHKHPAWQRIYKKMTAAEERAKELEASIPKEELEQFKQVTSSPAYIRASMEAQGYTQEAISSKLREMGHEVDVPIQDDVQLVLKTLNIDPKTLSEEGRQYINTQVADMAKVADIILKDRLGKILPKELEPLKSGLGQITNQTTANKMAQDMRSLIQSEGILDFAKDIEPELVKYMDTNPKVTQQEVYEHFKDLNHKLTIERLKTKGKKEDRDVKKGNLRQNLEGTNLTNLNIEKTGDFDRDADAFFDKLGIN